MGTVASEFTNVQSYLGEMRDICTSQSEIHKDESGNEYLIFRGEITQIRPEFDYAETLPLNSLDALIQMVKTEAVSKYDSHIYLEASSHVGVKCFLQPDKELRFTRQTIYEVSAKDTPGWDGNDGLGFEQALIAIRTRFQQTADTEYMLRLLSEISNSAKVTYSDNGIATSVVTKKGVDLQSSEQIRPIITLAPYRTFQEITQPESQFHIRITEKGIRFIEADGGMWKLAARKAIAEYLKENLSAEIEAGRVHVML
jgi:hypothetical protein